MSRAESTRLVGKTLLKVFLFIAIVRVNGENFDAMQRWLGVTMTWEDFEANQEFTDHTTARNEDECLFAAEEKHKMFCFGDYDGNNCHLMTARRRPQGLSCGMTGIKCMTKFDRYGE